MPLFVSKNGQTFGPHEPEEIATFLGAGEFLPEDYCWQDGWTEWRPISAVLPDRAAPAVENANPPQNNGHIPADIEIIGTLKLPGERVVTCRVDGEIHSPSTVIIPAENRVKARIKAESAVIFGTVEGDIQVTGRAVLKSSSTLHGDIRAARVLVEEGATFNGKSHVNAKSAEPSGKTAGSPARKKTSGASA
jgi:cytoskeletal protein CcmA (bactofilin family)